MMTDLAVLLLFRANLAIAAAILTVMAVRHLARRTLGPELAYGLWTLVPVAALTSLFPTLQDIVSNAPHFRRPSAMVDRPDLFLAVFLAGAGALLAGFALSEWRFRRLAARGRVGPAVVGLSWPSIVVPSDYRTRFDAAERRLIREHERTHMLRNHPRDNRLIALIQLFAWFNPLVHLAARCARLDQELACDAVVIEHMPHSRRLYGETLLKAQNASPWSAFACALTEGGRHPLEVRIRCLGRKAISVRQYLIGGGVVGGLALLTAVSVWVLTPLNYMR